MSFFICVVCLLNLKFINILQQFGMGADLAIRNGRRPHNSEWAQTLRPYLTPAIVEVL